MSEQDSGQEKTEKPTERRLKEALEQGQVLTSRDFMMGVILMLGAAQIYFGGRYLFTQLVSGFRQGLDFASPLQREVSLLQVLADRFLDALILVILFATPLALVAIGVQTVLGGGLHVIWQNLALKASRIDPAAGLARMFGPKAAIELAKSVAKVIAVGVVGTWFLLDEIPQVLSLSTAPFESALEHSGSLITTTLFIIIGAIVVIGCVDAFLQWRQHNERLLMTRQEMKDEHKQTEGSPEVKQRIRRMQQEMAQRGSVSQVEQAQVVIVNPKRFAVALRYDFEEGSAPKVLAKGTDQVALSIREKADMAGIPVLTIPLLARALFYTSEIGGEIHADLYRAVATILSFVFQAAPGAPIPDVDVPEELRFDANGRKLAGATA